MGESRREFLNFQAEPASADPKGVGSDPHKKINPDVATRVQERKSLTISGVGLSHI